MIAPSREVTHSASPIQRTAGTLPPPETTTVSASLLLMDRLVDVLIQKAKSGLHWPDLYEHAGNLLFQLGLPTRRGLLAAKRLRNAKRYAGEHDFGAAAFELRLIRSQLA